MAKYRKKPVVVEAIQWTGKAGNLFAVTQLVGKSDRQILKSTTDLIIPTLEGDMIASINDWIIIGVHGEPYPCKPDIFEKTYEKVKD